MDFTSDWAQLLDALTQHDRTRTLTQRHELLQRALELACTVGDDSAGCSVTEAVDGGFHTPANSNALALELDLAQYAAGDGPCVAACRDKSARSISVMASRDRYPDFTEAALRLGVGSSLSLPLPGVQQAAALNLYATNPSAFEAPRTRATAELLARCVARLVPQPAASELPPSGPAFEKAMTRRRLMQQAVAVTGVDTSQDRAGAFATLTRRSRDEGRSIFSIARDVIADE